MGMSLRAGLELGVVIFSLGLFVGYHVWLLFLRGRGIHVRTHYRDLVSAGKLARAVWTEACCAEEKEGILAVQTARNAISACTFLAATAGIIATWVLNTLLDVAKTERMKQIALQDPMFRNVPGEPLAEPLVVLTIALGTLFTSFVCLAQSVREYSHLGFYIRAVPSPFNPGALVVEDAMALALKAGFAFSLGLRFFYFFVPVALWSVGVTALLVASVLLVLGLYQLDKFVPVERRLLGRSNKGAGAGASPAPEQRQGTDGEEVLPEGYVDVLGALATAPPSSHGAAHDNGSSASGQQRRPSPGASRQSSGSGVGALGGGGGAAAAGSSAGGNGGLRRQPVHSGMRPWGTHKDLSKVSYTLVDMV